MDRIEGCDGAGRREGNCMEAAKAAYVVAPKDLGHERKPP